MADAASFRVSPEEAGHTVAAILRRWLAGQSWSQVRKLIAARRVRVNGEVWLDDARRLRQDDVVEVLARPAEVADFVDQISLRHVDDHIVIVEKPAGIPTVRHPVERQWSFQRRRLVPTLDDLVLRQLGARFPRRAKGKTPRLRIVQRLDKETSGLIVFARTVEAERGLGKQFARHTAHRKYLAIVPGEPAAQTVRNRLVRDRGDGRRGSSPIAGAGKDAVTHIEVVERLPHHTLVGCKLETGRTHQIRIHLAELGHPVCGDKVYGKGHAEAGQGECKTPRLALHAAELGFLHPVTREPCLWDMPLPPDLREFLDCLRQSGSP